MSDGVPAMSHIPHTLAVFAKEPRAGAVKTRLARATSPEWAAAVARAFLRDTLDRCATVDADRVIAFTPADAEPFFEAEAAKRYRLVPQTGDDLGQRLPRFLTDHLTDATRRVVVLGTDSPTVPLEYVTRAFELLERHDVVLGPATDGGYYLLGCARRVPPIFEGIAWGEPSVLAETVGRLQHETGRFALLPPWYDVDTFADWRMLAGHVAAMRLAGCVPGTPRTEALIDHAKPEGR